MIIFIKIIISIYVVVGYGTIAWYYDNKDQNKFVDTARFIWLCFGIIVLFLLWFCI